MRPALLSGAMLIPLEALSDKEVAWLKKKTTYNYWPMGEEEPLEVRAWRIKGDYLAVPRTFGIGYCNRLQIDWEDRTSQGVPIEFPETPEPREYQIEPLDRIESAFDRHYDFIFQAHTGWGKTLGALMIAARLGVSTLVVVDQENLKDQWIEALTKHFGLGIEDIGIIQGPRCDYEDKPVTIAMIQTLSQRKLKSEVYSYHGFMVVDEVHTAGAPTFSQVLMLFSAAFRMGVSATPKRSDGLQKALEHNLGNVEVVAAQKHDKSALYFIRNDKTYSWYANISPKVGRVISEVSEDGPRNLMAAEVIQWLYHTGRDVLVLSDRIEHLKNMQALLYYMGVDIDDVGLYTGYDPVYKFTKDPRPKKFPRDLHKWRNEDGELEYADFCPVDLILVRKRIPKAKLVSVKTKSPIILATYGMFQKGVDEPRLSGGIDLTPRSKASQQHGRILRKHPDKPTPIWVTIVDDTNYRLVHSFISRLSDYADDNSVIYEWDEDGGLTEWSERKLKAEMTGLRAELKSLRIETRKDGHNTLVTKEQEKQRKREQDKAIAKRIHAQRRSR